MNKVQKNNYSDKRKYTQREQIPDSVLLWPHALIVFR